MGHCMPRVLWFLVWVGLALPRAEAATPTPPFHGIADDDRERVEAKYDCGAGRRCRLSRVIVQRPSYDGPPGFTAIGLTSRPRLGPGRTQELAVVTRGQIRLLGVHRQSHRVTGFRTVQQGATYVISQLVVFDAEQASYPVVHGGEAVGPAGAYQYASCGSDGRYCLLVDSGVTLVEMSSGRWQRTEPPQPISQSAADPAETTDDGYDIGDGYRVSGEFMEMQWRDSASGALIVRGQDGRTLLQVEVAWQP